MADIINGNAIAAIPPENIEANADAATTDPIDYLKNLFEENTHTNIKDSFFLKTSMEQLLEALVLQEELLKFNFKRVFSPADEPVLQVETTGTCLPPGKRIFDQHDKNY